MATRPTHHELVLWDIDHTLIETRGTGTRFYEAAFEIVTGRNLEHRVQITGRTELAIIAEALRLHGIEADQKVVERYQAELARQYAQNVDELRDRGRALPGASAALAALTTVTGVTQSVLTGNLRSVALIKLRTFDLDQYLDLDAGAFGDDNPERSVLIGIAQGRANARYGLAFDRSNTWIIGDSESDVAAALSGDVKVIGVASGTSSADQLRDAGAKFVLPDLTDVGALVSILDSSG